MKGGVIGTLMLGALAVFAAIPASAAPADRQIFCSGWRQACDRTCPAGPGKCNNVCTQRQAACMKTGCFFFKVPSPRCQSGAINR